MTPHPGEAARLLRTTPQQVQANRLNALRNVSRRFGNAWVVLKGHQTLIGRSSGEVYVNPSGNPHLAQGGSGDVLGGISPVCWPNPTLRAIRSRRFVTPCGSTARRRIALRRRGPTGWTEDLVEVVGTVKSR
jgi:hypothetical protein